MYYAYPPNFAERLWLCGAVKYLVFFYTVDESKTDKWVALPYA